MVGRSHKKKGVKKATAAELFDVWLKVLEQQLLTIIDSGVARPIVFELDIDIKQDMMKVSARGSTLSACLHTPHLSLCSGGGGR